VSKLVVADELLWKLARAVADQAMEGAPLSRESALTMLVLAGADPRQAAASIERLKACGLIVEIED
jgi:hypothetical protein